MRMLPLLVVLPLCAAPALAQTVAPPPTTTAEQPAQAAPVVSAAQPAAPHRRGSWEQHFAAANTTHDGHLTLEQARSAYITVARHFAAIDTAHKGYVTLDDVRAWHKTQREARHRHAGSAYRLQARPAMHHTMIDPPTVPTGAPPSPPKIGPQAPS